MASRMRRPDTVRLEISQGDWLLVKKYLTAGEQRQIFKRTAKAIFAGDTRQEMDMAEAGISMAAIYLLNWSLMDLQGQVIPIERQPLEVVASVLDSLPFDDFKEIVDAIEVHHAQVETELLAEKNGQSGGSIVSVISPSAA